MTEQYIHISSMFGYNTGQPAVSLVVHGVETQMSPARAREVAFMLLQAAEAAVGDAYLFSFANERVGVDVQSAANLIEEFRQWRLDHKVDEEAWMKRQSDDRASQ